METRKLLIAIIALFCVTTIGYGQNNEEILKKADFYRGGQVIGIAWDISVRNIEKGELKNELGLKVEASFTGTQQFALVSFMTPKKYSGQRMLLRGNNMWIMKRGLRRPVTISGRQRLSGSAANADVASANYYLDYNIKTAAEEKVEGNDCWVFDLEAKNNFVSYSKIKYWIDKGTSTGIKAEYYGKSGKLIKTALFEYQNEVNYKEEKHKLISKITIFDQINKEDKTILNISNPVFKTFNSSKFLKNSLLE